MLLNTQEPNVLYKSYRCFKTDCYNVVSYCWKSGCIWPGMTLKKIAKKYPKQQFVSILRQILRPKPARLPNFWDHVSKFSFFQSFFVVLMTGLSAVRQYLQIWFKDFKRIFLTKMGRENCENRIVVKDTEKKPLICIFCFFFEKYVNRSDL